MIQPGETPDQNGQPRSFYSRINERNNEMVLLTYRPYDDLLVTPCWPSYWFHLDLSTSRLWVTAQLHAHSQSSGQ